MERSFANLIGAEHYTDLLDGYDALATCAEENIPLTPAAAYTSEVLKLDAVDSVVDGQESFLDSIKRGSTKVWEWIKQLIRSIKEWLFGKPRRETAVVQKEFIDVSATLDIIMKEPEKVIQGEVISSVMNSHMPEPVKQEIKKNLNKLSAEEKKIINTTPVEVNEEKYEELRDKTVNEMLQRLTTRLDSIRTNLREIDRIDPEQDVSRELNLVSFMLIYGEDGIDNITKKFAQGNSELVGPVAKRIVGVANEFETALGSATKALEKMSTAIPVEDNDGKAARRLARAGSVVKELGEACAKMRDLIMTLDSQLMILAGKVESMAVRTKLMGAMKETNGLANDYMQAAIDEMMK